MTGIAYQLIAVMQDNSFPPDIAKSCKHFDDPRGEQQIRLTNRLALALSQLNINSLNTPITQSKAKGAKKQDFLYVCLGGIPPFDNQFGLLQLPGECLQFRAPCFRKELSDQQKMVPYDLISVAKMLHQAIEKTSKNKPIVMIYHSFGTYIFAQYCHLFRNDRIIGVIDIGGAPIRFYPIVKTYINDTKGIPVEFLKENLDIIFKGMEQSYKKMGLIPHKKKEEVFGTIILFQSQPGFKEMFEYVRNMPRVLKCFIYGKKDTIFHQHYLHEKMIFFSQQKKFEPAYDALLQKAYQRCWGKKCLNVQEKFVYCIDGGYHSLHMQKKLKEVNNAIIQRYLGFLEEVYTPDGPKL